MCDRSPYPLTVCKFLIYSKCPFYPKTTPSTLLTSFGSLKLPLKQEDQLTLHVIASKTISCEQHSLLTQ